MKSIINFLAWIIALLSGLTFQIFIIDFAAGTTFFLILLSAAGWFQGALLYSVLWSRTQLLNSPRSAITAWIIVAFVGTIFPYLFVETLEISAVEILLGMLNGVFSGILFSFVSGMWWNKANHRSCR